MKAMSERERFAAALEEDIVFGRLKSRKRLVEQDIMDRLQIRRRIRFPTAKYALDIAPGKRSAVARTRWRRSREG